MLATFRISSRKYYWDFFGVVSILLTVFLRVDGWHDLGNSQYHCWALINPSDVNMVDCPGFSMEWLTVPDEVISEEGFNVTYKISANQEFFDWGVRNDTVYATEYGRVFEESTGVEAKDFCSNNVCPSPSTAAKDNCCLHHINVHSCPQDSLNGNICGPWVPPDGDIFTHTRSVVSELSDSIDWRTEVRLVPAGTTSIIAHIRIGNLQAALHHVVQVLPKTVCGNGVCEEDRGENCEVCPKDCGTCPLKPAEIAAIVIACIVIVCIFVAIILYFYIKQQKMLWDESWIICYDDIRPDIGIRGFMGSVISIQKSADKMTDATSGGGAMAVAAQQKQIFTQTGIYNGQTIAIKGIKKSNFSLTKAIRKEVKQVRDLSHSNLCKFIGGCIEEPNVCICSEYCPKGSLNDVLLNDDIPLNWGFRFSFCADISRAMAYLHTHKLPHGRLKSNNCIIDDRWMVKVSDYGLKKFREEYIDEDYEETYQKQMAKVYLPPEALDDPQNIYQTATDVYSFSIILVEIATRNEPCSSDDLDDIDGFWRPEIPDLNDLPDMANNNDEKCPCPKEYLELIEKCWAHDPNNRPAFSTIKQILHRINPNKSSPVDMMMQLMEKYSKHLEVLVAERTQDLVLEKQKTDRLLYSMLPKPVADELRQGKSATAETFNECTIFFSDIVGFTSLSSASTPFEVVALLNKLYVTFDSIIDSYDVYKVETIGDAYMVVSGLPKRNEHMHAHEIASMALDLVEVCETFVIPHKPDYKLRIRAGIHSGSVVAGVVGLKMPRYCLFGDTVNTASRMESTGEALKIQASDACCLYLKQIGCFKVDCRGEMEVKGKGLMKTWWVVGKDKSIKPQTANELVVQDFNQIVDDDKDNREKKLSLEERSDDLSCRKISLPGSLEEKEINEGTEKFLFSRALHPDEELESEQPAVNLLPPHDNGGLNIPLDNDARVTMIQGYNPTPSPTDNMAAGSMVTTTAATSLNGSALPPVETIAEVAIPMENMETNETTVDASSGKEKKKHKKKKKHKEKKKKAEEKDVEAQNELSGDGAGAAAVAGGDAANNNDNVSNGNCRDNSNINNTGVFGSSEPLLENNLERGESNV
ncbi:atrial natriuretic peptide receptor 2-like [Glandiceps talaboti]